MRNKYKKIAAVLALAGVIVSCVPDVTVAASTSIFPAAGGALAAGNGTSMRDIRATIARNAAKQSAISNHTKIKSLGIGGNAKIEAPESSAEAAPTQEAKPTEQADPTATPEAVATETPVQADATTEDGAAANDESVATDANTATDESAAADESAAPAETSEDASSDSALAESAQGLVVNGKEIMPDANKQNIEKVETPSSKAVNESTEVNGVAVVGSAAEGARMEITANEDAATISEDELVDANTAEPADMSKASIDVKPEAMDVAEGEEDLSDKVIAQVDVYVNVRDIPSEQGEVVGKLYNHSAGTWLSKEGDWYKIKSGSVIGWVKGQYVVTGQAAVKLAAEVGERVAVVTTTTLKIREDASTEASVLGLVPMEDRLTVLDEKDGWVKVSIEEGDGWVSKEFVSVSTEFPKAESKAEEEARLRREAEERRRANAAAAKARNKGKKGKGGGGGAVYSVGGGGAGSSVANFALQFVGNPYVYGGTSLTNGTDCSGFTMGVYRNFGVSLPHSSGAQRSCGYGVGSLAEAQPGDLICYSGHVALYIGGGQIVHASTAKTGIKVSNASYRNILAIRRIF